MKQAFIKIGFLFFALAAVSAGATAQKMDPAVTKALVESKSFVFKANFASSQGGRTFNLTSDYDLTIKPEAVISYLPYFGRAYSAPIGNSEGGIKFTSTDFNYTVEKVKKHSWEIAVKPHDASDVQDMYLTVFDNGSANLRVNSTNRQSISFTGYITEIKEKKKAF